MTDDDLEQLMRAGLQRRAGEADTTAPVAQRAVAAARRRRGGRVAAGAAALAVAAVAVSGVVVDRTGSPGGGDSPGVSDPVRNEPMPATWRTEYWHDLAVDVPADWGWGGAPAVSAGSTLACGVVAMVSPAGEKLRREDPSMPYVGRPIMQTDACSTYPDNNPVAGPPRAPYVWLGAAVEPGTVELGDGYTQVTREVNGSTLTVATQDAALRARILGSATGGETCFSEVESMPAPTQSAGTGSTGLDPDSLTFCAYQREGDDGPFDLVYATILDRAPARAFVAAADVAPAVEGGCTGEQPAFEFVLLRAEGPGPRGDDLFREYLVDLGCSGVTDQTGGTRALTRELVEPWAVSGVAAVLYGPDGGKGAMLGDFIGLQG